MSSTTLFVMNQRYSFELYGTGILPRTANNVVILADVSGELAEQMGYDVATLHANVYPSLPKTMPVSKDYREQRYYIVQYDTGAKACYGEQWINHESITMLTARDVVVKLANVEPAQLSSITEVLNANGFEVMSIEEVTTVR